MMYQRCVENISTINRKVSIMENLLEESSLNRLICARELSDLRSKLEALAKLIEMVQKIAEMQENKTRNQVMKNLPASPGRALLVALLQAWVAVGRMLKYDIADFASKSDALGKDMIKKQYNPLFEEYSYTYHEQGLLERLYTLSSDLKTHMEKFEISVEKEFSQLGYEITQRTPITLIFDLITFKVRDWPSLNDRWACAACYLASLEVTVNKACKKLGIKAQSSRKTDEYKKKFDALTNIMKQKGIEMVKIEKDIVSRLYDYRNKVLHGGYIPNDTEFNYIIDIVPKFIQNVQRCI